MKRILSLLIAALLFSNLNAQTPPSMGQAAAFAVLANDSIKTVDTMRVKGNAGAGTYIASRVLADNKYTGGTPVSNGLSALSSAKSACTAQGGSSISGTLAGQTFSNNVYAVTGNALLKGAITFSGDTNAVYIFNITGNLQVDSSVIYGLENTRPSKIFWNVGGTVLISTSNALPGIIMSAGNITLDGLIYGTTTFLTQGKFTITNDSVTQLRGFYSNVFAHSSQKIDAANNYKHAFTCVGVDPTCQLVTNNSFETVEGGLCPDQTELIHIACDWESFWVAFYPPFTGTPELFSECDGSSTTGVPYNIYNSVSGPGQNAHGAGTNYSGIFYGDVTIPNPYDDIPPFTDPPFDITNDERLEKRLYAPLVANKVYYMEFYTTLADISNRKAKLSVYPATYDEFMGYPLPPIYQPSPFFTTAATVPVNSAWNLVTGCLTTTRSDIDIVAIKVHTPSLTTETSSEPGFYTSAGSLGVHNMAYYYIDDVKILPLADAGADFNYNCALSNFIGSNICAAISGATYSWSGDVFTLANATIVSPSSSYSSIMCTAAGTYTFYLTVTYGGCVATDTIVVTNGTATCTGTTIVPLVGATYSGTVNVTLTTMAIFGDLTIASGTTTIRGTEVKVLTGKKILVQNGATLNVDSTWIHSCGSCSAGMWAGITVEPGGTLNVRYASRIEDATAGITAKSGAGVPVYAVNKAIFNKNTVDILVQTNSGNMSGNSIKNAIFTCRTVATPTIGTYATGFTALKAALTTNTSGSLTPYPTTTTLLSVRSKTGVESTGITSSTFYLKVGAAAGGTADMNFFDYHDYGIFTTNSRVEAKNCRFQNMAGAQPVAGHGSPPINAYGVGIFAPIQTVQTYNVLVSGGTGSAEENFFYDCFRGIELNNYYEGRIIENTMNCASTPALPVGNTAANCGVFFKDVKEVIEIKNCPSMLNWITGIYIIRNTAAGGALNPSIDVNGNTMTANASGYTTTTIYLADVSGNTITTVQPIYIRNNTISDVKNGIKAVHIKNNLIVYNNPDIALRYTSSGTMYGVNLEGCDKAEVKNNEVYSLRGAYGSSDNWDLRGIWVKTSTNNKVFCNILYSLGQCMVYEGTCTSTTNSSYSSTTYGILGNTMDNARTGLMLRSTGVIGQQGASTFPNSNSWNNAYTFPNGRTYAYSSATVNTASKLYCLTGGANYPPAATNHTNGAAGTEYNTGGGGLNTATGSLITCPTTYVPAGIAAKGDGIKSMDPSEIPYAEELNALLAASQDSVFSASNWMMQRFIFNEIKEHEGLQEDSTLYNFYSAQESGTHGLFHRIASAIESFDYSLADSYNASLNPENIIEENHKLFNSIYLAHLDSIGDYDENDSTDLYSIASQCAIEGGDAVYQSRNLLMHLASQFIAFIDECDASIDPGTPDEERSVVETQKEMQLYPNPNSGSFVLECNLGEQESAVLSIYDVAGKLQETHKIGAGTKQQNIDAHNLSVGMYFYEVKINDRVIKKGKVSIIK